MNYLTAKNITVKKNEKTILDDITLSINRGDFIAIMGKSGAGKSTLLNILSGIEKTDGGSVIYEGTDITKLKDNQLCEIRRKNFGFIFQSYNLIEELTVRDNILLLSYYSKINKKLCRKKLTSYAEKLDVIECLDKYPSQLSGGERQRAAIVRSLMADADVIFADEPTGALDSMNGKIVMEILRQLNKEGKTVIMVTHDSDMASYAKKIVHIIDGKVRH